MTSSDFEMTTDTRGSGRSPLAATALAAVAISAAGLIATSIGVLMNAHGFQSNSDVQTPLSDALFLTFVVGAVVAAIAGVTCYVRARGRSERRTDQRAAVTAAAYIVLAILTVVVVNVVNPNS